MRGYACSRPGRPCPAAAATPPSAGARRNGGRGHGRLRLPCLTDAACRARSDGRRRRRPILTRGCLGTEARDGATCRGLFASEVPPSTYNRAWDSWWSCRLELAPRHRRAARPVAHPAQPDQVGDRVGRVSGPLGRRTSGAPPRMSPQSSGSPGRERAHSRWSERVGLAHASALRGAPAALPPFCCRGSALMSASNSSQLTPEGPMPCLESISSVTTTCASCT